MHCIVLEIELLLCVSVITHTYTAKFHEMSTQRDTYRITYTQERRSDACNDSTQVDSKI